VAPRTRGSVAPAVSRGGKELIMEEQKLVISFAEYNKEPRQYADLSKVKPVFVKIGSEEIRIDAAIRKKIYALLSLQGILKGTPNPDSIGRRRYFGER
jgi:hypothetical protein